MPKVLNDNKINQRIKVYAFYILLALIILAEAVLLLNPALNIDERYTYNAIHKSFSEMMDIIISDVHPPLYYISLYGWQVVFGKSIFSLRFFSFIPFAITLLLSIYICKNISLKSAVWYTLFFAGNSFVMQKGTELRMYSWLFMWCTINAVCCHYIITKGKNDRKSFFYWGLFAISGLLSAYNQYYGILAMIPVYLGLLISLIIFKRKNEIRSWLAASLFTIIGYLPWLPYAIRQVTAVNADFWISKPTSRLGIIRELFVNPFFPTHNIYLLIMLLIPFMLVAKLCVLLYRHKKEAFAENSLDIKETLASLICTFPLWFTWAFCTFYMIWKDRPILVSRYLIASVVIFIFASSIFVKNINKFILLPFMFMFVLVGFRYNVWRAEAALGNTTFELVEIVNELEKNGSKLAFYPTDSATKGNVNTYLENVSILSETDIAEENICYIINKNNADDDFSKDIAKRYKFLGTYNLGEEEILLYINY